MMVDYRLLEIFVPDGERQAVGKVLSEHDTYGAWHDTLQGDWALVRALVPAQQSERVLDALEAQFAGIEHFRVVQLRVDVTVPRPEHAMATRGRRESAWERVGREELYAQLSRGAQLGPLYVVMVALSTIVAAAGMLNDNVAVIIGAMVIAPLLGPNVALGLATTLGDTSLMRSSLRTNLTGILLAFALSALIGVVFVTDPLTSEVALRTRVHLSDLTLALASGAAGALAFSTGVPATLVGVMVAVALLPPVVATGLLISAAETSRAAGALLLLATNVICVNLAAVGTFLALGIRPRAWWSVDRARRASRGALVLWLLLMTALAGLIVLWNWRG